MSVASEEAEKLYPDRADLREAYHAGRNAHISDEEIDAAARMLFGLYTPHSCDEYDGTSGYERKSYRAAAQITLSTARIAANS